MVQLQVINWILKNKDIASLLSSNIDDSYFCDYKKEFDYIKDNYDKYHEVCDRETFLSKFPTFEIVDVDESFSSLISNLRDDFNIRKLADTFNRIKNLITSDRITDAVNLYKDVADKLNQDSSLSCIDILKDTSRYEDYVERSKDFSKFYVPTGFKELDDIVGGFDREEELAVIVARPNVGKCLAKGTKILMSDGTLKNIEDVEIGDKVQSLNRVNTVKELHRGISRGYKIIPNVGDSFIVSDHHILTVMKQKEKYDENRRKMIYVSNEFELQDMYVEDYLKLSEHRKHFIKLYRPSVEYDKKNLEIPPYILGSWLGDGTSREVSITSIDDEIIQEWNQYATLNNLSLHKHSSNKSNCATYYITCQHKTTNVVKQIFKKYNLLNNKHIPLDYMTGDRLQRLELLAGILDTDGYFDGHSYSITQKSKELLVQIAQLCRGLGFKVGKIKLKHNFKYNTDYYIINISGPTYIIPCRLDRKKNKNDKVKQSKYILTNFKVEQVDSIEYFGFTCDGDSRFMLGDNTLTHNSWFLLKCATTAVEKGLNVGLYSGEMSERKVGYRFDTLVGHINNGGITHGNISYEPEYKKYIDELPNKFKGSLKILTPKMINGPADVNALKTFIEQEHLDILFIDQLTLLEDQRHGKSVVEKMGNISKDLKNLQVMVKKPIVSVTQLNREKNEDGVELLDLSQIGNADRIGQDATMVIGISKDKKDANLLKVHLVKSRDSENSKILSYYVDFNKGFFTYVPEEGEESDVEISDASKYESRYENSTELSDGDDYF